MTEASPSLEFYAYTPQLSCGDYTKKANSKLKQKQRTEYWLHTKLSR